MTLALAEEALRVAQRVHPEVSYELRFLQAEAPAAGAWQLPGEPWAGRLEGCHKLFVLADEPPAQVAPALAQALKQLARGGIPIGGLSAGVYPLAQLGLLDGYRAAVHWRWQDDFTERFPKVIATSHLFDWDRDRLSACGGLAVLDLLLAVLARDHGAELAGAVSEELVVERIREGGERQRIPLQNRIGSSHPKLTQAVLLMEANIEEPLTTDEIAQHVLRVAPSAGAHLQAVPQPRAEPVLPGAAPEQGAPAADADQQVDHPDRACPVASRRGRTSPALTVISSVRRRARIVTSGVVPVRSRLPRLPWSAADLVRLRLFRAVAACIAVGCLLFRPAGRVPLPVAAKVTKNACPAIRPCASLRVRSLHRRSRGARRRAILGPSRLSRHPCRSTPSATIPLALLKGAFGAA